MFNGIRLFLLCTLQEMHMVFKWQSYVCFHIGICFKICALIKKYEFFFLNFSIIRFVKISTAQEIEKS